MQIGGNIFLEHMLIRKNDSYKMNTMLLSRAVASQTVTHGTVVLSLGAKEPKPAAPTVSKNDMLWNRAPDHIDLQMCITGMYTL